MQAPTNTNNYKTDFVLFDAGDILNWYRNIPVKKERKKDYITVSGWWPETHTKLNKVELIVLLP